MYFYPFFLFYKIFIIKLASMRIKKKDVILEATLLDVSSERISHNVVELWWEGNVLMGKLEIIMSPGFINQGIISCEGDRVANYLRKGLKIGVSSRGVGSL